VLGGTATAGAAERFAAPNASGASGAGGCTEAAPCSIRNAIEDPAVADGDIVTLLPGSTGGAYETQVTPLTVGDAITLRSRSSDPVPVISAATSISTPVIKVNAAATLQRLRVESTTSNARGVEIDASGATVERSFASAGRIACLIQADNVLIRDSVCWNPVGGGNVLAMDAIGPATNTARLRGDTIVAKDPSTTNAILVLASGTQTLALDAANTIASGDVQASSDGSGGLPSDASVAFTNSNYATEAEFTNMGSTASVTDPGTGTNQLAPPAFVDAANGDFHELASSSATLDRGTSAATLLGSTDLDGATRMADANCDGSAEPDIGAYELAANCPGPPKVSAPDTTPPDTKITKKVVKGRTSFSFSSTEVGSTFECALDGGKFKSCASPKTVKVKAGRHTFAVRARDAAGNVDATPAKKSWSVKRKRA